VHGRSDHPAQIEAERKRDHQGRTEQKQAVNRPNLFGDYQPRSHTYSSNEHRKTQKK
jgi:hypothetical protein